MRKILEIISIFCLLAGSVAAQLPELKGCEYRLETLNTPDGLPFYAVKDEGGTGKGGTLVFTAGSNGWVYSWTFDGVIRTDGEYASDSSSFSVRIPGDGLYSVTAEKPDAETKGSGEFRIFYVHVPEFRLSLHDIYNCEEIKLTIDDFVPAYYDNKGVNFYGTKDVEYLLSGRTLPWKFTAYQAADWEIPVSVDEKDDGYTVTVTDKFGFSWESEEVRYTSVIPKAKMSFKLLNTVKVDGYGTDVGQAPLEVEFTDESENAQQYEWYLYKDTVDLKEKLPSLEDSLMDNQIRRMPDFSYTYEHPGYYAVKLKAINTIGPNQCWDTTEVKYVKVIPSLVNVPNVFTPNGDGVNDVFKVQVLSVISFRAVVVNRWGRKVHEWTDPEGGWDGRINGSDASPGTYYYIITARGLEKYDPPRYVKKGPLLLVR